MKRPESLAKILDDLICDIRAQQDSLTAREWVKLMALEANLVVLRAPGERLRR